MKRKRGRPLTAHLRRMHLASCIDDWVEENNRQRGSVKDALLDIYEMQRDDKRDVQAFLRTAKKDLRLGRHELRELQDHLRRWRRRHPRIF